MSMDVLMILLAAAAALTGLVTEAFKKMIGDEKIHAPNILAAIISVIVGCAVCVWYIVMHDVPLDAKVWAQIIVLVVLSWLCAMNGFDKVKQTIDQLIGKNVPTADSHTPDSTEDDLK